MCSSAERMMVTLAHPCTGWQFTLISIFLLPPTTQWQTRGQWWRLWWLGPLHWHPLVVRVWKKKRRLWTHCSKMDPPLVLYTSTHAQVGGRDDQRPRTTLTLPYINDLFEAVRRILVPLHTHTGGDPSTQHPLAHACAPQGLAWDGQPGWYGAERGGRSHTNEWWHYSGKTRYCRRVLKVLLFHDWIDDDGVPSANGASPVSNGDFRFHRIEEEDVLNLLQRVDINKASGVDQIGARVLRMAAEGISHSLTSLFNSSLDTGQVPVEWKSANIFLVPKSGTSECIDNFFSISLLPVVAKVFERLVHQQLLYHLQKFNILHTTQSGFTPGIPHRMSWWVW